MEKIKANWVRRTICIDPKVWDDVQTVAVENGMSMSGLISKLLRDWRGWAIQFYTDDKDQLIIDEGYFKQMLIDRVKEKNLKVIEGSVKNDA